jgi:Ca-activated chloride channel family protein
MLAEDIQPNRLKFAQSILLSTLNSFPDARIGLIPFAGQSLIDVPLTRNFNLLKEHILALNTHSVPVQGTLISEALDLAIHSFSKNPERSKILLLITDGEDHEPKADSLGREFHAKNIHLLILGMGTQGGTKIPVHIKNKSTFLKDKDGNIVITRIHPEILIALAQLAQGKSIQVLGEDPSLKPLMENYIHESARGFQEVIQETRFPLFLVWAILFLILEFVLFERKNRAWKTILPSKKIFSPMLLLLALVLCPRLTQGQWFAGNQAQKAYQSGNFKEAIDLYQGILKENHPENPSLWKYNLACAQFHEGNYASADSLFHAVLAERNTPGDIRMAAWYNLGNTAYQRGHYSESIRMYIHYLHDKPGDSDALYNLAYARWKLKKNPEIPPPPPESPESQRQRRVKSPSANSRSKNKAPIKPHLEKEKGSGSNRDQNLEKNW